MVIVVCHHLNRRRQAISDECWRRGLRPRKGFTVWQNFDYDDWQYILILILINNLITRHM